MDALNEFLINYGYWGMAIAAFLAGTFVPFSSEVVMGALLVTTGMNPVLTVVAGTIGNVAGSMMNYTIGTLAKPETVQRWFHIPDTKMEKAKRWVDRYGVWTGLVTFLPILGTAIAIALGIMRANVFLVLGTTTLGKLLRYLFVAYTVTSLL